MESLLKKHNMGQLLLIILFIIYLIMGYNTPYPLANFIDTVFGKVIVCILAFILLASSHPVLGILGLIVAFELIRRSNSEVMDLYIPSETNKFNQMLSLNQVNEFNQFPYTLEQEVVKKMTPNRSSGCSSSPPTFKPLLENNFDASPIHT